MKNILTILFLVALGFSLFSYSSKINAQTPAAAYLSGYAWSSNIGWIQFESKNIQVSTAGYISGYAWSSNVGWLQFGGLNGAPGPEGSPRLLNGKIIGWAKFLSANGTASGWDGWVLLSGNTHSISLDSTTNKFSGYAWGDDVIGWIDFSGITLENDICSNGAENWPTCTTCSDGSTPINGSCIQTESNQY